MTRTEAEAMISSSVLAADLAVMGTHKTRNGIRLETLDTQAGMRAYYKLRAIALRRKDIKVVCGETNNGTGRFFVRVSGLTD